MQTGKKLLFALFFFNTAISSNNFSILKNYHLNELSLYQNNNIKKSSDNADWINLLLINDASIPMQALNNIALNPTTHKEMVVKISQKAAAIFLQQKKEILNTIKQLPKSEGDEIKISLDTLYRFLISSDCDIIKYPQREIIQQIFFTFDELMPAQPETVLKIKQLFSIANYAYRQLRKPLEIINQIKAIDYIQTLKLKAISDINIDHIITLNSILLKDISDNVGTWRKGPCKVQGYNSKNPDATEIPHLMQEYITWLQSNRKTNPIEMAVDAHLKLLKIHPFIDGNKRTALLVLNLILALENRAPFIISGSHKEYLNYYYAVDQALTTNDSSQLYAMIANHIEMNNFEKIKLNEAKKIGIYTGTFDPLHLGHDNVMRQALEKESLDFIIIIPNSYNSSKPLKTDLEQRRNIIFSAYKQEKNIFTTHWDRNTVINYIKQINPTINIVGIIGSDSAAFYHHRNTIPYDANSWIVAIRDEGHGMHNVMFAGKPTSYTYQKDYSSTDARDQLKQKDINWNNLPLHKETIDYIQKTDLYRNKTAQ